MKSWYRVTEPSEAKYLMFLDYGVAGSSTKVFSHNDEDDIVSSTRHHRYFQITVIDAISETPVYEIKVASRGKSSTFGAVAECIFEMALKDFPQQLTTKESIMMDNCGTQ